MDKSAKTNVDFDKAEKAWEDGKAAAMALKVGDKFYGASPAAQEHGYDGFYRSCFIEGYLLDLPQVYTDDTGTITKLEPKPHKADPYMR